MANEKPPGPRPADPPAEGFLPQLDRALDSREGVGTRELFEAMREWVQCVNARLAALEAVRNVNRPAAEAAAEAEAAPAAAET